MNKRIIISTEIREKIKEVFGVSDQAIWEALRYKTKTDRANKIRVMALKNGGKIFGEIKTQKRDE